MRKEGIMTFFSGMFLGWVLTRLFAWGHRRLIHRELNQIRESHLQMGKILESFQQANASMIEGRKLDQTVLQSALAREAKAKAALEKVLSHFGVTEEEILGVMEKVDEESQ